MIKLKENRNLREIPIIDGNGSAFGKW